MDLIDFIKEKKGRNQQKKELHSLYFINADLLVAGADSLFILF